jgi:hypothetical protein
MGFRRGAGLSRRSGPRYARGALFARRSDLKGGPRPGQAPASQVGGGMFYVYLIHHPTGAHYVGMTLDPQRRLRQHNGEIPGGVRYTLAVKNVHSSVGTHLGASRFNVATQSLDRLWVCFRNTSQVGLNRPAVPVRGNCNCNASNVSEFPEHSLGRLDSWGSWAAEGQLGQLGRGGAAGGSWGSLGRWGSWARGGAAGAAGEAWAAGAAGAAWAAEGQLRADQPAEAAEGRPTS